MASSARVEGSGVSIGVSRKPRSSPRDVLPYPTICPLSLTAVAAFNVQPGGMELMLFRSCIVPLLYRKARRCPVMLL